MSIIFSVQNGQGAVAVNPDVAYSIEETRQSYAKMYYDLNAGEFPAIEANLQELAVNAGDQAEFYTRFVIIPITITKTVPASPPDAYIMDPDARNMSVAELQAKFGWDPSVTTVVPIELTLAVPFYNE